jgi:hypothetical protein
MFRCQIMLLSVSVFGCEFVALLDSGASRVFVGQVGWRKLEALGFKLRRTSVEHSSVELERGSSRIH